jgi:hypothetical protein
MRIKMLRTLGVKQGELAKRQEGEIYDVPAEEGRALIGSGLAETIESAKESAKESPKQQPK